VRGSFPVVLAVLRRRERIGSVVATDQGVRVVLAVEGDRIDQAERVEALQLLARVAARVDGHARPLVVRSGQEGPLADDGFIADGQGFLVRPPGPFVRRTPRATTMDGVYARPLDIPWNHVPIERELIELLLARLRDRVKPRVLELGAGFGRLSTTLERAGLSTWGVDVSPTAIARTRELVAEPERFVTASAAELPWSAGKFDAVLDVGCLHCMDEPDRSCAVGEAARVLRADGFIVSRVFAPRSQPWLDAQPFETDAFGLAVDTVRALFSGPFEILDLDVRSDFTVLVGQRA
jgi:SAM-dependent methyltransferase